MRNRGLVGSLTRVFSRSTDDTGVAELFWNGSFWSSPSVTGIQINQQTALQATVVMACVRILAEDVSKMTPWLYKRYDVLGYERGGRKINRTHPLARCLLKPNDWQTWAEFCRQMTAALSMRGNAWAVMLRNYGGDVVSFVPINPDRCALWQNPDGGLYVMVTRAGLHEMSVLRKVPFLIPYEDMFHLKDLTADGLVGMSPIAICREAIALSLGQEQQYARLMGQGARPSGILTTEKTLGKEVAARMRDEWQAAQAGLVNSGRTAVLENGLKWQALSISSVDLQFLQMRQFQVAEICRLFRVPPHMVGDLSRGTFNNIVQQSQEYRNNTLTSHTSLWEERFALQFNLEPEWLEVDFDETRLLKADLTARFNAHRVAVLTGWENRNEVRLAENQEPREELEEFIYPSNELGSDATGEGADGAGKPSKKIAVGTGTEDGGPADSAPGS